VNAEVMDSSLKFIILGAGIAGLTAAYLLKEAGHEVAVLEKCPLELNLDCQYHQMQPDYSKNFLGLGNC